MVGARAAWPRVHRSGNHTRRQHGNGGGGGGGVRDGGGVHERRKSPPRAKNVVRGGVVDYYAILNVGRLASRDEVKKAYKSLAREWHPDVGTRGEVEERESFAMLLNEAYATLSHQASRAALDVLLREADREEDDMSDGFNGEASSRWDGRMCATSTDASRAVFVNEAACIGCRLCASVASETFAIESEHGRARAVSQWSDDKDAIQDAMDSCPVDCIYWVSRDQLPFLEHVMRKLPRPGVHTIRGAGGNSARVPCPFVAADDLRDKRERLHERQRRESSSTSRGRGGDNVSMATHPEWLRAAAHRFSSFIHTRGVRSSVPARMRTATYSVPESRCVTEHRIAFRSIPVLTIRQLNTHARTHARSQFYMFAYASYIIDTQI